MLRWPSARQRVDMHARTLYIDESKAKWYIMAAAVVTAGEEGDLRRVLTNLRLNGQRRLHFAKESDRRRRLILSMLTRTCCRVIVVRSTIGDDREARRECLDVLVQQAVARGASRLVLEQDDSLVRSDRLTLGAALRATPGASLGYEHRRPSGEPLLWIPDAVAWCVSRGGEWRRRASPLIDELHPRTSG